MTDSVVCDLRRETGLGSLTFVKRADLRHKDFWVWCLTSNSLRRLLPTVLPYLRIKHRHAELLLEYLSLANRRLRRTPEELAAYYAKTSDLAAEVKRLNHKSQQ